MGCRSTLRLPMSQIHHIATLPPASAWGSPIATSARPLGVRGAPALVAATGHFRVVASSLFLQRVFQTDARPTRGRRAPNSGPAIRSVPPSGMSRREHVEMLATDEFGASDGRAPGDRCMVEWVGITLILDDAAGPGKTANKVFTVDNGSERSPSARRCPPTGGAVDAKD